MKIVRFSSVSLISHFDTISLTVLLPSNKLNIFACHSLSGIGRFFASEWYAENYHITIGIANKSSP
jgi:hypothetical protein